MNNWLKNLLKKIKLNESTISMLLGVLVVIVVGALVINYFRNVRQPAEELDAGLVIEEQETIQLADLPTSYTVQAGDHLWAIAERIYGSGYNWVDIAQENDLTDPDGLAVGQQLNIPVAAVREPITVAQAEQTVFGPAIESSTYTVQEGDHLWGIAVRTYGDGYQWVKIASENGLEDPDLIHPGNVLQLPR